MSPFRSALLFTGVSAGIALMAVLARDLQVEWRTGHLSLFQTFKHVDWIRYRINKVANVLVSGVHGSGEPGLDVVRLYIPKKAQLALMREIPASIKVWQEGRMIYPDGSLNKVKVRYRGDNPFNWAFGKKSLRVKTRKKKTIGNVRSFDYVAPQFEAVVDGYLLAELARDMGILSAPSRLVELHVNERNTGVLLETERLDESFLRNAGLMPVNLYKGEQQRLEKRYRADIDLFNNPALWTKVAVNNHLERDDTSDLAQVIGMIRRAENSELDFEELKKVAPIEAWARFGAHEILSQHFYDAVHNARLLIDTWSGQVVPVLQDPQSGYYNPGDLVELNHSGSRNGILRLYSQNSEFLYRQFELVYESLKKDGVAARQVERVRAMEPRLTVAIDRDPNIAQNLEDGGLENRWYWGFDFAGHLNAFLDGTQARWAVIAARLSAFPPATFDQIAERLVLTVDGEAPLDAIRITFSDSASLPAEVAWDANANGRLDPADTRLPISVDGSNLTVEAAFLPNWVRFKTVPSFGGQHYYEQVEKRPTSFVLIADRPLVPTGVSGRNALSGERQTLSRRTAAGDPPGRWNRPVFDRPEPPEQVWTGRIAIHETRIVDIPTRILPGTEIALDSGASLIFRARVTAEGTKSRPVRVVAANQDGPWGTFALLGPGTAGSRFRQVTMENGSGDVVGFVHFTSMLSVHNTRDVVFNDLRLRRNHRVDDMMHVVYARDVVINRLNVENALSDTLDVDISDIRINGGRIAASGNDAIDLMTSKAVIRGITLIGSGDKGISAGERSEVMVVDTSIADNTIGIESKDGSVVRVVHTDLTNNRIQLNAYWKNWRYGSGGTIRLDKSMVLGGDGKISAAKHSRIFLRDSTVSPPTGFDGSIDADESVDVVEDPAAATGTYMEDIAEILAAEKNALRPEVRGTLR